MGVPPPSPDYCTKIDVSIGCTVEGSLYGYRPNMGANGFLAAFFGICCIINLGLGIRYRTWTYMIALTLGCLGEMLGYVGRILLNDNPFHETGFMIQICCLVISPAFVTAGVYLTLKHLVLTFGEEWSRLKAGLYTWIFITCDILSLLMQGAGGGIASSADDGSKALDIGTDLMIAGVSFQVVVLAVFGAFIIDYFIRTYNRRSQLSEEATRLIHKTSFRAFLVALVVAYITILTRCAYRIPELSNGWRSELMRNETEFIILEGIMILLAVAALTAFHPGYCFPALANTIGKKAAHSEKRSAPSSDDGSGVAV